MGAMPTSCAFLRAWLSARCATDRGATLAEYALLVAVLVVLCIALTTVLGRYPAPAGGAGAVP
jgi:pilus assembly protein Flp/PilA